MMKYIPDLDKTLDKAVEKGIFGTKERSVIYKPDAAGIKAIAEQQFELAKKVTAKGLVPIVEPEVDINAENKEKCEDMLLDSLMEGLRKLNPGQKVIFKLTLPEKANLYLPLMG